MPKYELMYIIGNQVSDDNTPRLIEEVKQQIEKAGAKIEKQEEMGQRKLAYPIKKTRNGYYVLVQFDSPSDKLKEIEANIKSTQEIIRHLIINIDEALVRMERDQKAQAKLKRSKPKEGEKAKPADKPEKKPSKKINIDLDAEIEKAIEPEDLK